MRRVIRLSILSLLLMHIPISLLSQTSPEKYFGFRMGEDRKLVDAAQIVQYLKKLDSESAKLKLVEIGISTQKRPLVMAVITAEANMQKLDSYIAMIRQLQNPRETSESEARRLAREAKAVVLITCNLHSNEIASSQMSLELAYRLVSGNTPYPADEVLNEVIFLLVPTSNPDGTQMVCDWYRKYLGTPFEGGDLPWLYHVYAGHDNNRDWFMFNLPETRAISRVLYRDWLPQIHLDEHQMGSRGARMFIPPFMDPPVPHIQPLLWRSVALCGATMAYDMERYGFQGVVQRRSFTGWWIGACDDTSWLHNVVGLLSEAASANIASPVYVEPGEVNNSYTQKRIDFPNPWRGGWWRLRDIVDYELTLSFSLIRTAALYREEFLYNFYRMVKDSIEQRNPDEPFAFIIPNGQSDPLTTAKMIEIAMMGGVEVQQAESEFRAEDRIFPVGSYVILASQPYKPYTLALFERQKYPDLREKESESPIPPYDNAGWTLPLMMGVDFARISLPFAAKLKKLSSPPSLTFPPPPADAAYFVLDPRINASYSAIFALLKEKAEIWRISSNLPVAGETLPPGAFVIRTTPATQKTLNEIVSKKSLPVHALHDIAELSLSRLKLPRIAIYQPWTAPADEGWTRYVLDDFAIPYTIIHNADFKGKAKEKLVSRFDVIILPSENIDLLKTGKPDPKSEWSQYYTPLPPEYEGGIEQEGVDRLKAFVAEGGHLITLNQSSELVIKEFSPPMRNALENQDESSFFCPTSILRLNVDNTQSLGYGMKKETPAMFSDSLAFSTLIPDGDWDRRVVASYPEDNLLLSGWLIGESHLTRRAAVVDLKYKLGRIFVFGFPVQNRAQTHGTYKLLFNALLYPR